MNDNFLSFSFFFFCFFYLLHEWKIILIDLWWSFLYTINFWHIINFNTFLLMLIMIDFFFLIILHIILILTLFFCLWLITNNTTFWSWWHKRPIRIDFLLNLVFLNNYFLLYNRLFWYKIFFCMFITNG